MGHLDSEGSFTLDSQKAVEKTNRFGLEKPHYYLGKLVQGLVALQPQRVEVRCGRKELKLRAVGPSLSSWDEAAKEAYYQSSKLAGISQNELETGFLACASANLRIELRICQRMQIEFLSSDGETRRDFQSSQGEPYLELRLFRPPPESWLRRLMGPREIPDEHSLLSLLGEYCPVDLFLDGRRVNQSTLGGDRRLREAAFGQSEFHLAEMTVREPDLAVSGAVGIEEWEQRFPYYSFQQKQANSAQIPGQRTGYITPRGGFDQQNIPRARCFSLSERGSGLPSLWMVLRNHLAPKATVHFIKKGLLIQTLQIDLGCPGILAVCTATKLRYDASGYKLVENDAFQHRINYLRHYARVMAGDLRWALTNDTNILGGETYGSYVHLLPDPVEAVDAFSL